jgi:hypothetical protein
MLRIDLTIPLLEWFAVRENQFRSRVTIDHFSRTTILNPGSTPWVTGPENLHDRCSFGHQLIPYEVFAGILWPRVADAQKKQERTMAK